LKQEFISDSNSKTIYLTFLLYSALVLIIFRKVIFLSKTSIVGEEFDLFGGIFWWSFASTFKSEYAYGISLSNKLIGAPEGHYFITYLDILQVIPKTLLYFFSRVTDPIFSTNLLLVLIVTLNIIAIHFFIHEITQNHYLGIIFNYVFFSLDYVLHKLFTHPFFIFNVFLVFGFLYLRRFSREPNFRNFFIMNTFILINTLTDGYQILIYFVFHISLIVVLFIISLVYKISRYKKFLYTEILLLIMSFLILGLLSFYFARTTPLPLRTMSDFLGFTFSFKNFINPSYYNEIIQRSNTNVNDENMFSILPIIAFLILIAVTTIFSDVAGKRLFKMKKTNLNFGFFFILIMFLISVIMSMNIRYEDRNLSLAYFFYTSFPSFRVFSRIGILFLYLFILIVVLFLNFSFKNRASYIKNIFLPIAIMIFSLQNFFFLNNLPTTDLSKPDSTYEYIKQNTPIKSIIFELRDLDQSTGFIGWQYVHQRRLANSGPILDSKFTMGLYDPGFSCLMRTNHVDYVVVPSSMLQTKPNSDPLGMVLMHSGQRMMLFKVEPGKKLSHMSVFESGFHKVNLGSHSGYWTVGNQSKLSFKDLLKSGQTVAQISFQVSSLVKNNLRIQQSNVILADLNINSKPTIVEFTINLNEPIILSIKENYVISEVIPSNDNREVGVFITYPSLGLC
jgi:hypothetical protein